MYVQLCYADLVKYPDRKAYEKQWREENRERHRRTCNAYQRKYRERFRLKRRIDHVRRVFNVSKAQAEALEAITSCEICGRAAKSNYALDVDHCHTTGFVRGKLCRQCNRGIGHFDDNPERLEEAAMYLRQRSKNIVVDGTCPILLVF